MEKFLLNVQKKYEEMNTEDLQFMCETCPSDVAVDNPAVDFAYKILESRMGAEAYNNWLDRHCMAYT